MALKSWLASLKADVSNVSGVQAPIHAGLGRFVTETTGVSGVSGRGGMVASDTADTAGNTQTYQAQPAWALACTGDTADMCKKINTETRAANELFSDDLLTGWKVTIPDGVSAATLAKFRAASLALDAAILAAGGTLELPVDTGLNFQVTQIGNRCAVGLALWSTYDGHDDLQTKGA